MLNYYKMAFSKYTDFQSRSTREEFWWFFLGNILIYFGLLVLSIFLRQFGLTLLVPASNFITILFVLAIFIPIISISMRRLHDTGRSGRLVMLYFILPVIGALILFVFFAQDSQKQDNEWGFIEKQSEKLEDVLIDFDKNLH